MPDAYFSEIYFSNDFHCLNMCRWNTYVVDGHDVEELCKAFWLAKQVKDKPTCIVAKTFKGKGLKGMYKQHFKTFPHFKNKILHFLTETCLPIALQTFRI